MKTQYPTLLCIAGFDPSGGAGLQADIETAAAFGVRAVCVQTCNTIQDSAGTKAVIPTMAKVLARQLECIVADFDLAAVKIGLIPSVDNAEIIAKTVSSLRCPLIADPVLCDGTGKALCDDGTPRTIREQLLPLVSCATPNRVELAALVPNAETDADAAQTLLRENCGAVLVTSETSEEKTLHHALYLPGNECKLFSSPRLPGEFHGSGCTLSSAIAAQLALGKPLREAISQALTFTARALENADTPGTSTQARKFPRRL